MSCFSLSTSESTFRFLNTESKCRRHEVSIRLIDSCDSFRHQTRTFSVYSPNLRQKCMNSDFETKKMAISLTPESTLASFEFILNHPSRRLTQTNELLKEMQTLPQKCLTFRMCYRVHCGLAYFSIKYSLLFQATLQIFDYFCV